MVNRHKRPLAASTKITRGDSRRKDLCLSTTSRWLPVPGSIFFTHHTIRTSKCPHDSARGFYENPKWKRSEIKSFVSSSKRLYFSCVDLRGQLHISALILLRNWNSRHNFSGFYSLRAAVTPGSTVGPLSIVSSRNLKDVHSPKSLQISWRSRQTTKNTTVYDGKSILLRNRSNFYRLK